MGSSFSPINTGDVTGGAAGFDFEMRLDANGNKLWSSLYSGASGGSDRGYSFQQTTDGGYVLSGIIAAPGGNVTAPSKGGFDYTILKLDSTGGITWQKRYGGTGADYSYSIEQTLDGGYIVGGNTLSPISGDMTIASKGNIDVWILKLTSTGTISWQRRFGGANDDNVQMIRQSTDGGYIAVGYTTSSASGDVSVSNGGYDYWILKLDALGNMTWNKNYGGSGHELAWSVIQIANGNYIVSGHSASSQTGNVTQTNHSASQDILLLQLDASGNIIPLTGH